MFIKYPRIISESPRGEKVTGVFRMSLEQKELLERLGDGSPSRGLNILMFSTEEKIRDHFSRLEKKEKASKEKAKSKSVKVKR